MWPRATGQQQGPLSSLVADGVSPGPSGQGRGHDLSRSQEVLPRPWAQPAWCAGSADGVLRGQAGPLGTCLRVQGSRSISKPFVPRLPPGGPLPLQPSGKTNMSQWGAHRRPSSPHLQTWRSSEPGGCAPTSPTPPPPPHPILTWSLRWARTWPVIITAPARLSLSNFITGTPHLWTCPRALWELEPWNPRVEATCPGSPGGACGRGGWRRNPAGGPLSGASRPETHLNWHASSEPSLRPAVFSLALTMLS